MATYFFESFSGASFTSNWEILDVTSDYDENLVPADGAITTDALNRKGIQAKYVGIMPPFPSSDGEWVEFSLRFRFIYETSGNSEFIEEIEISPMYGLDHDYYWFPYYGANAFGVATTFDTVTPVVNENGMFLGGYYDLIPSWYGGNLVTPVASGEWHTVKERYEIVGTKFKYTVYVDDLEIHSATETDGGQYPAVAGRGLQPIPVSWDEVFTNNAPTILNIGSNYNLLGNIIDGSMDWFRIDVSESLLSSTFDVQFTDSSGSVNGITSWSWDFGDGSTSTEQNPLHSYTQAGTYTVSLTVSGTDGSDTETKTGYITVYGISYTVTPETNTSPLSATFEDNTVFNGETISSRLWTFGDGFTSTETSPIHVYKKVGDYVTSLTIVTDLGNTYSSSVTVRVLPSGIDPTRTTVCYCFGMTGLQLDEPELEDDSEELDGVE